VLLIGYYGYGNFGDELMREAIEDFFKKFHVEYKIALPTRVSKDTISRFNIFELIDAIYDSDIVIYGGGGLLQDITSTKSFLYYSSIIWLSLMFQKPVILFGNSLGPVKKLTDRFILKSILKNKNVFLFARDLVSYRYGKWLNSNTVLSSDPSVRHLKKFQAQKSDIYDLLIVPRKNSNIEKYDILKKYFQRIIVCPAQKTDIQIARTIANRLGCDLFENVDNTEELLSLILSSNFVISERFHPLLVAAYFGIPFISLEGVKTIRFFAKYTDRREFFVKDTVDVFKRIEIVKSNPLNLKDAMDEEAEKSFKELYRLMIKLSSRMR